MPKLTAFQVRVLEKLLERTDHPTETGVGHTGRSLAAALWPDSPAWHRRTRGRNGRNGALGGTMPMRGATAGWALHSIGLADVTENEHHQPRFTINTSGRDALQQITAGKPVTPADPATTEPTQGCGEATNTSRTKG
ncbi:hypothetical protein ACFVAJ_17690 [Agromyces sp. NPDC057679]|uniref:hypothetical protein n=1 Tax=Agromyces sp. NPDC057679 TaxID=3346207 RepID=UPI00366DCB28